MLVASSISHFIQRAAMDDDGGLGADITMEEDDAEDDEQDEPVELGADEVAGFVNLARNRAYQKACFVLPQALNLEEAVGSAAQLLREEAVLRRVVFAFREGWNEVAHHIESFDWYMNQLPQIIRERPPLSYECSRTGLRHTLRLGDEVIFTKPCTLEKNGTTLAVTPDDCRARRVTYSVNVLISVKYTVEQQEGTPAPGAPKQWRVRQTHRTDQVLLYQQPVMIGSRWAHKTMNPLDIGGYLIINGSERTVVPKHDMAHNCVYVFLAGKPPSKNLICEVRSAHQVKPRSTATLKLEMAVTPLATRPFELVLRLPFLKTPVPMAAIFRVLGNESTDAVFASIMEVSGPMLQETAAYVSAVRDLVASLKMEECMAQPLGDMFTEIGSRGIDQKEPAGADRPDKRAKHVEHLFSYEHFCRIVSGLLTVPMCGSSS